MMRAAAVALLILIFPLSHAFGQESPEEEAVSAALRHLDGADFHFTYSIWPSLDATAPATGEGAADVGGQNFAYSVVSGDGSELATSGDWRLVGGQFWFNDGSGWTGEGMDLTWMGILAALSPFQSYEFARQIAEEGQLEPLALVGSEAPDGSQADHYRFAISGVGLPPDGTYDIWISGPAASPVRVTVRLTPDEGQPSTVTYSEIGVPVSVEAPD